MEPTWCSLADERWRKRERETQREEKRERDIEP